MRFVQNEKENTFYLIFGIDKEDDKAKHSAHSPARQPSSAKIILSVYRTNGTKKRTCFSASSFCVPAIGFEPMTLRV